METRWYEDALVYHIYALSLAGCGEIEKWIIDDRPKHGSSGFVDLLLDERISDSNDIEMKPHSARILK